MTKTDFAELKEKLVKLDVMALSAEYIECCKRRQYNGLVRIEDMVKWQHSKDSAIISELIEIIQSFDERSNHDQDCHEYKKCMCGYNKFITEIYARLQKLRDGG